jgi:hypothetical protein
MTSRPDNRFTHEWHVAINGHCSPLMGSGKWPKWMYEAKTMADEVPRMVMLFRSERQKALPATHKQCSMTPAVPVKDNHLSCCLGVKCRECPELLALEKMKRSPEEIDTAKAWTCAAHIVSKGGDFMNEGYLLRVDDRMYWDNVYASLAAPDQESA